MEADTGKKKVGHLGGKALFESKYLRQPLPPAKKKKKAQRKQTGKN